MTLTKHLYELDEVCAALLWSIRCRDSSTCQFWIDELEVSGFGHESRQLLFVAWAMFIGVPSCGWLHLWSIHSTTRKGRRMLLRTFFTCTEQDVSIWWLLLSISLQEVKPDTLWSRWRRAARLSHEEFWEPIVCASTDERLDTIYTALQQELGYYSFIGHAVGFLLAELHSTQSLPESVWNQTEHSGPVQWRAKAYDAQSFFGRTETIPEECLVGLTQRGYKVDTIDHLRNGLYTHLRRSPYWQRLLWPEGTEKENPERVEKFWDTWFKETDSPDEWSLDEQQKSHGYNVCSSNSVLDWCTQWIPDVEYKCIPLTESERSYIEDTLETVVLTDYLSIFHFLVHQLYK
jgi:hypothetical protein